MAAGRSRKKLATGIECLHYALNLPTSVVITGLPRSEALHQAFEAARTFKPLARPSFRRCWPRPAMPRSPGIREIQNHLAGRRNGAQSAVDGVETGRPNPTIPS